MHTKRCVHCKIDKELSEENYRICRYHQGEPRYFSICRPCVSIYNKKYRDKYKEEIKESKKLYYFKTIEKQKARARKYRQQNKEKLRILKRAWKNKKKKEDPQFWLRERISVSIYIALKKRKGSKGSSMADYLPYSMEELKAHIESLFEPWMNWDNHGNYRRDTWDDDDPSTWTWQIDHIVPQIKFSYASTEDEGFKKAWSLENLRPYPAKNNVIEQANRCDMESRQL